MYGSTKVEAPPPRDYGEETRGTLQSQIDLAPDLLAAEQATRPAYNELDLQSLSDTLLGTENQRGLLDLHEQDIYPALAKAQAADRDARTAGEVETAGKYAGELTDTLRESAGNKDLIEGLQAQARDDLAAGYDLNPVQKREVQQNIRRGQAARGLGYGNNDAIMESLALNSAAEQRRRQRQGFASNVAGLSQATGADPFLSLFGRPSQTPGAASALASQGYGMNVNSGPGLFNPESGYASDLFGLNQQTINAANIANANNSSSMIGAGLGLFGDLGGGFISRIGRKP